LTQHVGLVYSSSLVANHCKTNFGTECGASVLICPRMQRYGFYTAAGPPTIANEKSISLDVYAF